MQQNMQEKRTDEAAKQVYEKPQFGRVSLFADSVLQACGNDPNTCSSPNMVINYSG